MSTMRRLRDRNRPLYDEFPGDVSSGSCRQHLAYILQGVCNGEAGREALSLPVGQFYRSIAGVNISNVVDEIMDSTQLHHGPFQNAVVFIAMLLRKDVFQLLTPGGGGYGCPKQRPPPEEVAVERKEAARFVERGSVFEYRRAQESV